MDARLGSANRSPSSLRLPSTCASDAPRPEELHWVGTAGAILRYITDAEGAFLLNLEAAHSRARVARVRAVDEGDVEDDVDRVAGREDRAQHFLISAGLAVSASTGGGSVRFMHATKSSISGRSSVMRTDCWNWEDGAVLQDDGIHVNWPSSLDGGWWFPGGGWMRPSSLVRAQLAAALGLPYAFASHFAPGMMMQAIDVYRERFEPSEQLDRPYVMLGFNVFAADTDGEARVLMTSMQQAFVNLRRGRPTPLQPPVPGFEDTLQPFERAMLHEVLSSSVAGSPETVRAGLASFIARTGADELMITSQVYDHAARLRSYEITAQARDALAAPTEIAPAA